LTRDLCRTALQSLNADAEVSKFVMGRFPELKTEGEKERQNVGVKMKL